MEITAYTWYFLITSLMISLALLVFIAVLIKHYIRTKSPGTILLVFTYSLITFAEISNTIGLWYYVFVSEISLVSGYFELSFAFYYGLAYVFLYFFANRHILEDNDLIKSLTSVGITVLVSVTTALMFMELINHPTNPFYYNEFIMNGPNIIQFTPSLVIGSIIFIPIFTLVHLRIIISLAKLRKSIEDKFTKRGFNFILFAVVSFVAAALVASFFTLPNVGNQPAIITLLHTLRIILMLIGIGLSYIGWTMPNWMKKLLTKTKEEENIE